MPDLTDAEIRKIVVNYVAKGFIPAIEFAEPDLAYTVPAAWCDSNWRSGLYDNRYWTLWKLPFFNIPMEAGDVQESGVDFVMSQKGEVAGTFPDCYARMIFFDPARQVQVLSFLIQRPPNDTLRAPMELRRKPATPPTGSLRSTNLTSPSPPRVSPRAKTKFVVMSITKKIFCGEKKKKKKKKKK